MPAWKFSFSLSLPLSSETISTAETLLGSPLWKLNKTCVCSSSFSLSNCIPAKRKIEEKFQSVGSYSYCYRVDWIPLFTESIQALRGETEQRGDDASLLGDTFLEVVWNHQSCVLSQSKRFELSGELAPPPHFRGSSSSKKIEIRTEMEAWIIRVVYFIVFSFLVPARFGSSAPYSEEGRALLRYRESERDKSNGSFSNWGEVKVISRLLNLLLKENMFASGTPSELKEHGTISDSVADGTGGFEQCRKCLAKTVHNATPRQLLEARQLISNQTQRHYKKQSPPPVQSSAPQLLPHWAIYTLSIAGVLCVAAVATAIYLLFSRRKKDNTVTPWATGLSGQLKKAFVTGVPSLERTELEAACEGFINVIGILPECTLYKGTLSSGVEIAVLSTSVNSAQQWSAQSEEHFRNKISVLSKVNHKNNMNLLGYCACDEPFTRMMVFEYAPCGSLFEHLHIREAEHLDWQTRLRIIMGVAYCLEHMSQLDPPSLLPTNLSSSSIYLTEDYAAKIVDIEFWKDDNKQDAAAASREVSQESVVYKFGILLLEVISGRRPISEDDRLLVLWASSYLDGKRPLSAMADRTLVRSSSAAPEKDVAALCDVVRLCVRPETGTGKRAISMGEVARLVRDVAGLSPEQAAPRENPLWWAELEIASSETGGSSVGSSTYAS